jgi:hypothetical protein
METKFVEKRSWGAAAAFFEKYETVRKIKSWSLLLLTVENKHNFSISWGWCRAMHM